MPVPIHPQLLRRAQATRRFSCALVAVGIATAFLMIAQARLLADWIAHAFAEGSLPKDWGLAAFALLAVFTGRGLLAWLASTLAHHSSAAVKSQLRRETLAARLATPVGGASSASVVRLLTQGFDTLDNYFAKYLPQLGLAATVPFIVGGAIALADWPSAIIVAVTLPLIPIYMALIGWTTQQASARSFAVANRLANHFADLIAGLGTLQAFARARAQRRGVELNEESYRSATMKTLYVSFLSSFALELLASLSVAVVAVTVGFRLVYGDIGFATALFVLILAPEAFLPVRQVGAHFHDSADAVAAADAAFEIIDAGGLSSVTGGLSSVETANGGLSSVETHQTPQGESHQVSTRSLPLTAQPTDLHESHQVSTRALRARLNQPTALLELESVSYSYPESTTPALEGFSLTVAPGEVVALSGASGGGKSTALALAMGFIAPSSGAVRVCGRELARDPAAWRSQVAWVAQEPGLISGTVADNVALGHLAATEEDIAAALAEAGAEFSADKPVGDDGEGLSAGERRRVALARALVRIRLGAASLLILDEPTAGLDAETETRVLAAVAATGAAALIVSHRPAVLAAAHRVVTLTRRGQA